MCLRKAPAHGPIVRPMIVETRGEERAEPVSVRETQGYVGTWWCKYIIGQYHVTTVPGCHWPDSSCSDNCNKRFPFSVLSVNEVTFTTS